jgi:hypothetical protein
MTAKKPPVKKRAPRKRIEPKADHYYVAPNVNSIDQPCKRCGQPFDGPAHLTPRGPHAA